MSDIEITTDPRLPRNVVIAGRSDNPERYAVEYGERDNGDRAVSVVDMEPDHDDETVTEADYAFRYINGIYVHEYTGLHRHGDGDDPDPDHGVCEQTPADENPAPSIATEIITDYFDAPVATPDDLRQQSVE